MSMVHHLNKIRVKIGLAKRKTHSSSRIRWLGIWYLTHTQTSTFLLLFIFDFFPQSPVISSQANIHSFGSSFGNRQGFLGNFSASCGHLTQNERDPGRPSDHRASISFAHLYGIAPSFLSFLFIKRYHGCNKRVTFRLFRMCVCVKDLRRRQLDQVGLSSGSLDTGKYLVSKKNFLSRNEWFNEKRYIY
jgi:hypothetical protein